MASIMDKWTRTGSMITVLLCAQLLMAFGSQEAASAAESVSIKWEDNYGGAYEERGVAACPTGDHGYAVVGQVSLKNKSDLANTDVYLAKTDRDGRLQWEKTFNYSGTNTGTSVLSTRDGGYIIGGTLQSDTQMNKNACLIKVDQAGKKTWERRLGGDAETIAADVQITGDNGYILTGNIDKGNHGTDVYLAKLDAAGGPQWEKKFGGNDEDHGKKVLQTSDGGYIVTGETSSLGSGGYDLYVIKIDASGKEVWEKTYGGKGWEIAESVAQTIDGGYIIVGRTSSFNNGDFDTYIVKTDANGNQQWEKTFGSKGWDVAKSIEQDKEGGYWVAGWTETAKAGKYNFFLLHLDGLGNLLATQTLVNANFDEKFSIQPDRNGGFIVSGVWIEGLRWGQELTTQYANTQAYLTDVQVSPPIQSVQREQEAQKVIKVAVGGKNVTFDMDPMIRSGQVFVSAEELSSALGIKSAWKEIDNSLSLTRGDNSIRFIIGRVTAWINEKGTALSSAPLQMTKRVMVPLRLVCESLGATVAWDGDTNTVLVTP